MNGRLLTILVCTALALAMGSAPCWAQLEQLAEAERLLLHGSYAESGDAFLKLAYRLPVQAALGQARCRWQQGDYAEAVALLDKQLQLSPNSKELHAQRAQYALMLGDLDACRQHTKQTLEIAPEHSLGRWVQAELWRVTGQLDQACTAYRELADFADRHWREIMSPRELHLLGQALAQHARFNHDKKRFPQLTAELYPRVLRLDPDYWPAYTETGLLLAEKYNAADAEAAFRDALEINPHSADAFVGLARLALDEFELDRAHRFSNRALKTNPNFVPALLCQVDAALAISNFEDSLERLERCHHRASSDVEVFGRLTATLQLLGKPTSDLDAKLASFCSNPGEYHAACGAACELARRYPQAAAALRAAIESAPQLLGPRGRLGMLEMRLGHEAEARRLLEESFAVDPYNVRVKNQLEVLDLLDEYETIESEHFVIRYDSKHDQNLARLMSRHAEACYADLSMTFGFELPEKALIEVFHEARGTSARQWFGARMLGLPNIHTIAACGGNIVAMVSPTSDRTRRNWGDILRHEIVHLITIQQTDYAIPHWLTEGCAVWQEGRPPLLQWKKLLVSRVPSGDMFDLQNLNGAFLRPRSADDWHLAYCQADQYVRLLVEQHGEDGLRRLLAAYRDNRSTGQAIEQAFAVSQDELEKEYASHLSELTAQFAQLPEVQVPPNLTELVAYCRQHPDDTAAAAQLALAHWRRGEYPEAGRLAEKVLAAEPDQPVACLVKARLLAKIGDEATALQLLAGVDQQEQPELESLRMLAGMRLRQGQLDEAKRLYQLGDQHQPYNLQWTKALAVIALRQHDDGQLTPLLERLAAAEPDNLVARKKLLQLAETRAEPEQIQHWAEAILLIEPNDPVALRLVLNQE